jgi:hypothetical protein
MTDDSTGGVQPLRPDGTVDTEALDAAGVPTPRTRRGFVVGSIIAGLLLVGAVGAVVAWRTLVGSAFASADAIPIDADVVITFDLLQVRDSERLDRLVQAFAVPAADQGLIEDGDIDVIAALDEGLEAAIGITLEDDVIPWVGRSVSLGLWIEGGLSLGELDAIAPEDAVGLVLVAGVRNGEDAAGFVADVAAYTAEQTDGLIERVPLEGGTLTSVTGGTTRDEVFMWLDGEVLIVGPRRSDVSRALDARRGESIRDHAGFERMMDALPSDRLVAMYVGTGWLADLYDDPLFSDLGGRVEALQDQLAAFEGVGMSVALRDEGVAFDLAYAVDDPGTSPIPSFDAAQLQYLDRLPDEALLHIGAPIDDEALADAIDSIREQDPQIFDEAAQAATEFLGVDLFDDVLPALGRESIFAVVPAPEGFLADEMGVGLGVGLAVGVVDRDPVATAIASLEDLAAANGISITTSGGASLIGDGASTFAAYALSGDTLAIGTGPTIVDALVDGSSPSVRDNARYRALDGALPGEGVPFFVDLQGFFDTFDLEGDDRAIVDALQAVGAAGEVAGDVVRFEALIAIEY